MRYSGNAVQDALDTAYACGARPWHWTAVTAVHLVYSAPHILMRGSKQVERGTGPVRRSGLGLSSFPSAPETPQLPTRAYTSCAHVRSTHVRTAHWQFEVKVSREPRALSASCALLFLAQCTYVVAGYVYACKAYVGSRGHRRQTRHVMLLQNLSVSPCVPMYYE